jgi:hypothetical protein
MSSSIRNVPAVDAVSEKSNTVICNSPTYALPTGEAAITARQPNLSSVRQAEIAKSSTIRWRCKASTCVGAGVRLGTIDSASGERLRWA